MKPPLKFNKGQDLASLKALGMRMLESFLASPLAQLPGKIVAVEESLRATLDPQLPDVLARVDLIYQTPDSLVLLDLKTSRSRWNAAKLAQGADQLRLYQQLCQPMAQETNLPIRLAFGVVTKAKTPVAEYLELAESPEGIDPILERFGQVFAAMQAGNFYPNPAPQNCSTCPFQNQCPTCGSRGPNI